MSIPLSRRRCDGFTLIETVITIAILGTVLAIAYGVFSRTLASKEYVEARAFGSGAARATLRRIIADLESVTTEMPKPPRRPANRQFGDPGAGEEQPREPIFISRDRTENGIAIDDLAFTALVRRPTSPGTSGMDVGTIRYLVLPDIRDPEIATLHRETQLFLGEGGFDLEEPDPERTLPILENVAGIEFRFHDGEEWVGEWDSTNPQSPAPLPLAIEITLAIELSDGDFARYRTAIDLPMAAAAFEKRQRARQQAASGDGETP